MAMISGKVFCLLVVVVVVVDQLQPALCGSPVGAIMRAGAKNNRRHKRSMMTEEMPCGSNPLDILWLINEDEGMTDEGSALKMLEETNPNMYPLVKVLYDDYMRCVNELENKKKK